MEDPGGGKRCTETLQSIAYAPYWHIDFAGTLLVCSCSQGLYGEVEIAGGKKNPRG